MKSKNVVLLTGIPRSGTTLCCSLLNKIDNTIALHEPIEQNHFGGLSKSEAVTLIKNFAGESRNRVLSEHKILSKQVKGLVPTNSLSSSLCSLREERVTLAHIKIDKPISVNFKLFIKHNALFTSLIDELVKDFHVYAIIRNPLATLASWQTVSLPINDGHIPMGENFDPNLRGELKNMESSLDRQIHILHWFYNRLKKNLRTPNIIRYEDIISTRGKVVSGLCGFRGDRTKDLSSSLTNQNASLIYKKIDIEPLLRRLVRTSQVFAPFYTVDDLESLAYEIRDQ